MKHLSALLLAAGLGLGLATAAKAAPVEGFYAESDATMVDGERVAHPYHKCHGASAGTADRACGSSNGGPVGGLF